MEAHQGLIVWCTGCIPNVTQGLNTTETLINSILTPENHEMQTIVVGSLALLFGLALCFYGYALFFPLIGTVGFLAGGAALFFLTCGGLRGPSQVFH
jgi:hypothetical protein